MGCFDSPAIPSTGSVGQDSSKAKSDAKSVFVQLTKGVPQGSVLGLKIGDSLAALPDTYSSVPSLLGLYKLYKNKK